MKDSWYRDHCLDQARFVTILADLNEKCAPAEKRGQVRRNVPAFVIIWDSVGYSSIASNVTYSGYALFLDAIEH